LEVLSLREELASQRETNKLLTAQTSQTQAFKFRAESAEDKLRLFASRGVGHAVRTAPRYTRDDLDAILRILNDAAESGQLLRQHEVPAAPGH